MSKNKNKKVNIDKQTNQENQTENITNAQNDVNIDNTENTDNTDNTDNSTTIASESTPDKPQLTDFLGNANEIFSTNKQKYESTMSSAIILLIFGSIGLFIELLGILDVINLPLMTFQYILVFVVFMFFIISGIMSYLKANSYVAGMNQEDEQRNKVDYFLNDLLTDQFLKDLKSEELSDEENYFMITEKLKNMILEKYPEYDAELLEYMIDDYLNEHFK